MLKKGVNILLGTSNETLKQIFRALADSLIVSETTTKEIIASYEAVGTYLGNLEEDLAGVCAVNPRCFVDIIRNSLHTCQQQQRHEGNPLP